MYYTIFSLDTHVTEQLDVEPIVDRLYSENLPEDLSKNVVGCALKFDKNFGGKMLEAMQMMLIRLRYSNTTDPLHGVFLLKTDDELDHDTVQAVVDMKLREGELMNFLKSAKIA